MQAYPRYDGGVYVIFYGFYVRISCLVIFLELAFNTVTIYSLSRLLQVSPVSNENVRHLSVLGARRPRTPHQHHMVVLRNLLLLGYFPPQQDHTNRNKSFFWSIDIRHAQRKS